MHGPRVGEQVDRIHPHRPGGQFHLLALAGELVGPMAADQDGRVGRGNLGNIADELSQHALDGGAIGHRGDLHGLNLAGAIVRAALAAQADDRPVALGLVHHQRDQAAGPAQADDQDTLGEGVQRAGVPDLDASARQAAHRVDQVVAAGPGRFANINKSVHTGSIPDARKKARGNLAAGS
jgi:hypothetical protein